MATIGSLSVDLIAETSAFRRDLGKASAAMQSSSAQMNRNLARVERGFGQIKQAAAGLAAGLASAFAVHKVVDFTQRALESADRLGDMAQSIGVTAEELQKLRFAAEQTGASAGMMDSSMQRFTRRLAEARGGTGEFAKVVKEFGIELTNADGSARSNMEVLGQLAEVIRNTEDPAQRLQAVFGAFGREGQMLSNLMSEGAEGLAKFFDQAQRAGVLSDEIVGRAGDINDKVVELRGAFQTSFDAALLTAFMASVGETGDTMAAVTTAATALGTAVGSVGAGLLYVGGLVTDTVNLFGSLNASLRGVGEMFSGTFGEAGTAVVALGIFGRMLGVMVGAAGPVGLFVAAAVAAVEIYRNWDEIVEIAERVYTGVKTWLVDQWVGIVEGIRTHIDQTIAFWAAAVESIIGFADAIYAGVRDALVGRFETLVTGIGEKVGRITGFFATMYDKVVGNSYVPDMVEEIGEWFARLEGNMVAPAEAATTRVSDGFARTADTVSDLGRAAEGFATDLASSLARGENAWDSFRSAAVSAIGEVIRALMQMAQAQAGIGGGGGGFGGILRSIGGLLGLGGMAVAGPGHAAGFMPALSFGGPRAAGGAVSPGSWYMVGERGPEPFVPTAPGTVIPNDRLADMRGGGGPTFNVDMRGASLEAVQRLEKVIAQMNGSIEQRAVSAVSDARRRGIAA